MEDLYPDPRWNFVFGQASLRDRLGVFSFARYDPFFYGKSRGSRYQELLLRRSAKLLVHETAHIQNAQLSDDINMLAVQRLNNEEAGDHI